MIYTKEDIEVETKENLILIITILDRLLDKSQKEDKCQKTLT